MLAVNVSQAFSKSIYVSTSGNDSNAGTESSPVATPSQALQLAASGDTIYLRGGVYNLTRFLWVAVSNITIASYPGESAKVVGGTADASGNPTSIFVIVANNVTLSDLEIQGGSYYGIKIDIDTATSTSGVTIRRCYVHHTGRDSFKTFNADSLVIEDCEIGPSGVRDSSNAEGIDSIGSIGVTIRRNYVHDTATTGIYIKGGARNGIVEQNRVVNTGHAGILLGQDTDLYYMRDSSQYEAVNCLARNNVIINAGAAGMGTYSGDNVRFENNTLYDVAKTYNGGLYVAMNSRDVPARNVTFKNNIVVCTGSRPVVSIINMSGSLVSDSNIFYRPSGSYTFYREIWPSTANTWNDLGGWQSGMNCDRASSILDPQIDSSNLCRPLPSSPAIDRGESLSEVPTDYSGTSRPQGARHDIGAHEYVGATTPPPNQPPTVSVTASPASGAAPLLARLTANASDADGSIVSYRWEFGDGQTSTEASPSHTYQAGSYTARVTVTDDRGATASASVAINATDGSATTRQNVIWKNVVGCSVTGNSLTKTASTTWGNAGAASTQKIVSGNGYLEFTAVETDKERMVGLSASDADQTYLTIAYAIHLNTGRAFYVYEMGVQRGYFGDFSSGDVFRVAVENGAVKYSRNNVVFYTSTVTPTYPLMADSALMAQGSTVVNAVMSGVDGAPAPPAPPAVRVLSPNTAEKLRGGSAYNVTWQVTGAGLWRHDVQLSLDGGATWQDVAVMLPGTATAYSWLVPNVKTSAGRIRVISYGGGALVGQDVSDANFTITKVRTKKIRN
jgi:hypothetical protein